MRKFAESYDDFSILQALLAKILWWRNVLFLEKLDNHEESGMRNRRCWYNQFTKSTLFAYNMCFYHE